MEPILPVQLESLQPYRYLFPKATVVDKTIKRGASVYDTVEFIPKIIRKTAWQVEKYVEQELKGLSLYDACKKLWHFVKYHIEYKKDEERKEQIRSPRRLIHDAKGDCDCFTTFIDACLYSLGIPTINRITKYQEDRFQHIYPIVPLGNGKYITMDCVVNRFNYEGPYTEKKDYDIMDLHYLDGIGQVEGTEDLEGPEEYYLQGVDMQDLFGYDDDRLEELGKLKLGKVFKKVGQGIAKGAKAVGKGVGKAAKKVGEVAKKGLHAINRLNPATIILRAGVLAAMKLNMFNVAGNLKWAYLTQDQAKQRGMDMNKYNKLKSVHKKLEDIFWGAGGLPVNLKKAILGGKGNKHHEVSGLGSLDAYDFSISGMNESTPLETLLGEIYQEEFVNGLEGTEGLGEVATATALTAATGVMGTIAALIKGIGNLFPGKSQDADSVIPNDTSQPDVTVSSDSTVPTDDPSTDSQTTDAGIDQNVPASAVSIATDNLQPAPVSSDTLLPTVAQRSSLVVNNTPKNAVAKAPATTGGIKQFWENNKKWIKPVGMGVVGIGVAIAAYKIIKGKKKPAPETVSGLNGPRKQSKKRSKTANSHPKKSKIALM